MPDSSTIAGLFNYWVVIFLMMTGFYIVIGQRNLVKSIIGLNLFQTSVFLLYITMGKVKGGTAPIIPPDLVDAMAHASHDAASHDSSGHGSSGDASTGHVPTSHNVGEAGAESAHGLQHIADDHIHETIETHANHVADQAEHLIEHTTQADGPVIDLVYSNPLPSVLMLTAIVVGIATTALALALIVRIREDYGTIEEDEILALDAKDDAIAATHLGEVNA